VSIPLAHGPNRSVKPTRSGLRPPRAAYLKRWAPKRAAMQVPANAKDSVSTFAQLRSHLTLVNSAASPAISPSHALQRVNVAGASRRSAAPGSQSVGVAGYSDGSRRHHAVRHVLCRLAHGFLGTPAPASSAGSGTCLSASRAQGSAPAMRLACVAKLRQPALGLRYAAIQHHRLQRHLQSSRLHIAQFRPAAPHPAIPKREPNPSVKPTHSGLRPPWAAYLKRWASQGDLAVHCQHFRRVP